MALDYKSLYDRHVTQLEDFWHRRQAEPRAWRTFRVFGRAVQIATNEARVLAAVDHSLPLFSKAPPTNQLPLSIQFVVSSNDAAAGSAPNDLMQRIQYAGEGAWLMMHLAEWGHAHVDLAAGKATVSLAPALARQPDLISQCLLNPILTNFWLAAGAGMLQASCLSLNERILLLLGPHKSVKSTLALHLALAGFRLLSNDMVFILPGPSGPQLAGFPVGKVKLQSYMIADFPQYKKLLLPEVTHDETKYSLDLLEVSDDFVQPTTLWPDEIVIGLLASFDREATTYAPASQSDVWEAVMANSLYYDQWPVWHRNLEHVDSVISKARAYHLAVGTNSPAAIDQINALFGR